MYILRSYVHVRCFLFRFLVLVGDAYALHISSGIFAQNMEDSFRYHFPIYYESKIAALNYHLVRLNLTVNCFKMVIVIR